ncbi:hypothetical protein PUN28_011630 [Cardiocondyla obscurior]|uniref:Uncharacterized protein n=1 Tax=Cardiocondyla obscurior TaxID=286306 RepID=A0AAW2FF60_9HYME
MRRARSGSPEILHIFCMHGRDARLGSQRGHHKNIFRHEGGKRFSLPFSLLFFSLRREEARRSDSRGRTCSRYVSANTRNQFSEMSVTPFDFSGGAESGGTVSSPRLGPCASLLEPRFARSLNKKIINNFKYLETIFILNYFFFYSLKMRRFFSGL